MCGVTCGETEWDKGWWSDGGIHTTTTFHVGTGRGRGIITAGMRKVTALHIYL